MTYVTFSNSEGPEGGCCMIFCLDLPLELHTVGWRINYTQGFHNALNFKVLPSILSKRIFR